jgi:hypothetical protein
MTDVPQGSYDIPPTGPQPQAGPYPPYGYPYPPVQLGTNTLAILALVFAFVFAPAAIVLGAVARKQIKRTGEQGMGLATAGLVLGIVFTAISVLWILAVVVFFASAVHQINNDPYSTGAALLGARARLGI